MIRRAFLMQLKPGCAAEYKSRHDRIWPELKRALSAAGVSDYSIHLHEQTGALFAVQKLAADNTAGQLPAQPVVRQWWDHMSDIMETNDDGSPRCVPLQEVFHLDQPGDMR